MLRFVRPFVFLLLATSGANAQQIADLEFKPHVQPAAYPADAGPRVGIDAAHGNFHTADERYAPFAAVLRRDGYRVSSATGPFTPATLRAFDVLVIANPLHPSNRNRWTLPTPSAFTAAEIDAVHTWVKDGGALLLIADHMPFPGAADALARRFGFVFSNGFATPNANASAQLVFTPASGLPESPLTRGRSPAESIRQVTSFTGAAFQPPDHARPVLVLPSATVSLEPRQAWEFPADTPKVPVGGWCQGALLSVGQGRVAVFGEAAMFTAQRAGPRRQLMGFNHPAATQNAQFLLNTLHWLTRLSGMPE